VGPLRCGILSQPSGSLTPAILRLVGLGFRSTTLLCRIRCIGIPLSCDPKKTRLVNHELICAWHRLQMSSPCAEFRINCIETM